MSISMRFVIFWCNGKFKLVYVFYTFILTNKLLRCNKIGIIYHSLTNKFRTLRNNMETSYYFLKKYKFIFQLMSKLLVQIV